MLKILKTFVYFLTILCIFDYCLIQWGCGLRQAELIFSEVTVPEALTKALVNDLHRKQCEFAPRLT